MAASERNFWWVTYHEGKRWMVSKTYLFKLKLFTSTSFPKRLYRTKGSLPTHRREIELYPEFKNLQR